MKHVGKGTSGNTSGRSTAHEQGGADASSGAVAAEERHRMIAVAAYHRAEHRGFTGGCELEDWLAAETEIEQRLKPVDEGP